MRDLPAGTITMLFSDIEGSTALLSRLGTRYGEALSAQRSMVRAAIAASHGREMGTEGDSFFVVFESAGDAVGCALTAQRALAGYDWPAGEKVRVRMGLHSGEPVAYEDGYIGMDVHRAARIAATAHGGQVVLSEPVRILTTAALPPGASFTDLGFHRLKDISEPEHIYQLAAPDLQADFPPLKSLGTQTNLPVPATPLVGRDAEIAELRTLIAGSAVRLVTLTGTGGVGKTRLALAAAAALGGAFPHGVFFVPLAAVRDADVMWKTLADSLDVTVEDRASDAVTGYLASRRALLVLDNLEQLDGAAGVVAALLAAAPGLVVLATSRRPLHVLGEHELPVPPLEIPPDAAADEVAACSAVQLFVQQAGMVRPGFAVSEANAADLAAICRRLDGLPLAIELAAARVKLLAPKALLARLGHSLGLAAAEAERPLRQQTLRNTVAWSYDLLAADAARVFRQMSVFAGGCDLDALAAVAAPTAPAAPTADASGPGGPGGWDPLEIAAGLQDVSLITVTEGADGEPRLGMLETIREYALERLAEAGELDETQRRHAEHYATVAEQALEQMAGPAQLTALDRLESEHDNLRVALSWSLDSGAAGRAEGGDRAVIGLRLVQAMITFWYRHGHASEGRRWLERAIAVTSDDAAALARLKHGLAVLLQQQGELDASIEILEYCLAVWRELGDREQQARELNSLGGTHLYLGDLDTARTFLEESAAIAREIGSDARLATALTNLGEVEVTARNLDRAHQVLREALELDSKSGDQLGVALDQQALAMVSLRAGHHEEALDLLSSSLDYVLSSGDTEFLVSSLELSACITAGLGGGNLQAARLAGAAEAVRQKAGMPRQQTAADTLDEFLAPARATVSPELWDAEIATGRAGSQEEMVALLRSPRPAREAPA